MTACSSLHNWLRKTGNSYIPGNLIDSEDEYYNVIPGTWRRQERFSLPNITLSNHDRHPSRVVLAKTDDYCNYFNNEGTVFWQWHIEE